MYLTISSAVNYSDRPHYSYKISFQQNPFDACVKHVRKLFPQTRRDDARKKCSIEILAKKGTPEESPRARSAFRINEGIWNTRSIQERDIGPPRTQRSASLEEPRAGGAQ